MRRSMARDKEKANAQRREDYRKNPEKYKKKNREGYLRHREERKAKQREYNATHKKEISERNRRYRESHKEELREYQKKYRETHKEGKSEYLKQYRRDNAKRLKELGREYRQKNATELAKKKKRKNESIYNFAGVKLNYAKRKGRIKQKPCEVCGDENSQAHHCDYNKPLDVIWLCPKHHSEWHQNNTPIYYKEENRDGEKNEHRTN